MDQDKKSTEALRATSKEYLHTPNPRVGGLDELEDADVDLWEEDAYLAGLVQEFLRKGKIEHHTIRIDSTIDSRLAKVHRQLKDNKRLNALITFRKRMIEVAGLLSEASNVPIEFTG